MFIFNAVFVPFFWLVNPFQILKLIKKESSFGRKDLTQRQANKLMEDYPYDIGKTIRCLVKAKKRKRLDGAFFWSNKT